MMWLKDLKKLMVTWLKVEPTAYICSIKNTVRVLYDGEVYFVTKVQHNKGYEVFVSLGKVDKLGEALSLITEDSENQS